MVNNRESYCYVIGGLLIRSRNMVFHGVIDGSLKMYTLYALKDKQHKPQELSEKLGVSLATFFKIKKDGDEKDESLCETWTTCYDRYQNGKIINPTSQNPSSQKPKLHLR